MIAMVDCQDRRLYRLRSRNLRFGVYREISGGFLGLRSKFERMFLDEENHYEAPHYATAQPIEALEMLPADIENDVCLGPKQGLASCVTCGAIVYFAPIRNAWQHHRTPTLCRNPTPPVTRNKPLHEWLLQMEAKYGTPT